MKIQISFIDKILNFYKNDIICLNILNKAYLIRIMQAFYNLSIGIVDESIYCFNDQNTEENLANKIIYVTNYLDISFNNRKFNNELVSYILKEFSKEDVNNIFNNFKKYEKNIVQKLSKLDLPLKISVDYNVDDILKLFKIEILQKSNIIDNLYLLLDIENTFKTHKVICFVNLSLYLTNNQLDELLKYSIYNNTKILLIESNKLLYKSPYEKIILVDEELEEI